MVVFLSIISMMSLCFFLYKRRKYKDIQPFQGEKSMAYYGFEVNGKVLEPNSGILVKIGEISSIVPFGGRKNQQFRHTINYPEGNKFNQILAVPRKSNVGIRNRNNTAFDIRTNSVSEDYDSNNSWNNHPTTIIDMYALQKIRENEQYGLQIGNHHFGTRNEVYLVKTYSLNLKAKSISQKFPTNLIKAGSLFGIKNIPDGCSVEFGSLESDNGGDYNILCYRSFSMSSRPNQKGYYDNISSVQKEFNFEVEIYEPYDQNRHGREQYGLEILDANGKRLYNSIKDMVQIMGVYYRQGYPIASNNYEFCLNNIPCEYNQAVSYFGWMPTTLQEYNTNFGEDYWTEKMPCSLVIKRRGNNISTRWAMGAAQDNNVNAKNDFWSGSFLIIK